MTKPLAPIVSLPSSNPYEEPSPPRSHQPASKPSQTNKIEDLLQKAKDEVAEVMNIKPSVKSFASPNKKPSIMKSTRSTLALSDIIKEVRLGVIGIVQLQRRFNHISMV